MAKVDNLDTLGETAVPPAGRLRVEPPFLLTKCFRFSRPGRRHRNRGPEARFLNHLERLAFSLTPALQMSHSISAVAGILR
jgi:hypothetical protein